MIQVVCARCRFDQFRLSCAAVDKAGAGTVQVTCVRCGSSQFSGIDPKEAFELVGTYMDFAKTLGKPS